MKNSSHKGFTLIELLVVIAIIGILSSVVLASLTSARTKGKDTALISQLSNMRAQAELYYGNNSNAYSAGTNQTGACGAAALTGNTANLFTTTGGLSNIIAGVASTNGGGLTTTNSTCNASASAWAAAIITSTGAYCVDSNGRASDKNLSNTLYSTNITTAITAGTFVCL